VLKGFEINITIGGQVCAGGIEIGQKVSSEIKKPNFSKVMLRKLARKLGTNIHGVVRKERSFSSFGVRIANKLESVISEGSLYGYHNDSGMFWHVPQYLQKSEKKLPGQISDAEYIEAFFSVGYQQANSDGSVIVKRGGCLNMKGESNVFHVGVFAPREKRIIKMADRLKVGVGEAKLLLEKFDAERRAWFRKIADTEPEDQNLYDLVIESDNIFNEDKSVRKIIAAITQ